MQMKGREILHSYDITRGRWLDVSVAAARCSGVKEEETKCWKPSQAEGLCNSTEWECVFQRRLFGSLLLEAKIALKNTQAVKHTAKTHICACRHAYTPPPSHTTYKQSFPGTGNPSTHVPVLLSNHSSVTLCMPPPFKMHKQVDRGTNRHTSCSSLQSLWAAQKKHQISEQKLADSGHSCPPVRQPWI